MSKAMRSGPPWLVATLAAASAYVPAGVALAPALTSRTRSCLQHTEGRPLCMVTTPAAEQQHPRAEALRLTHGRAHSGVRISHRHFKDATKIRGSAKVGAAFSRAHEAALHGNASFALTYAVATLRRNRESCSVRECNKLLRVLGDSGYLEAMVGVFEAMVATGVRPTQVTYGTLISRAGAHRQPKLASRMYRDMLRRGLHPDDQTLNSLINAYAKAGYVSKAYAAASVMRKLGVVPTLVTYNTLLDACARGGNVSQAYETYAELQAAGLKPNARTYSILIHLCARASMVSNAFTWFRRMLAAGETPNHVTFTALINACGRSGQLERAFAVLEQMQAAGLQPNVVTYTAVIDACAKGGELPRALGVFRAMIDAGVPPNRITCTALFHGCLTAGEVLLAREVVQHMKSVGLTPNAHSFTALLTATCSLAASSATAGNVGGARGRCASSEQSAAIACLLRQMVADGASTADVSEAAAYPQGAEGASATSDGGGDGIGRSIAEILAEMPTWSRVGRFRRSSGVIDTLLAARLPPPTALWRTLFDSVDVASELETAVERYHRARRTSLAEADEDLSAALVATTSRVTSSVTQPPPRRATLPAFANSVQPFLSDAGPPPAATLQSVFAIFTQMRAAGIQADLAAFNALINACASVGDIARAEGAFGEMLAAGLKPDTISYNGLVKACAVAGDAARCDRILTEMQQRTNHFSTFTPPEAYTYKHLMAVHVGAGAPSRVLALFEEMVAHSLTPHHTHYNLALLAITQHAELPNAVHRALRIYEAMRFSGHRLDTRTLLALVHMCELHRRHDLAARFRRERSLVP